MKYINNFYTFKVSLIFSNLKLIKLLNKYFFNFSYSILLNKLFNGNIYINNIVCKINCFVCVNNLLKLYFFNFFIKEYNNFYLPIIFEDNNLIVIIKNSKILIHPSFKILNTSIINQLLYYYDKKILKFFRLGILHRLDMNATGLMCFSKSCNSYISLIKQIKYNIFKRYYLSLLIGKTPFSGKIVSYIIRFRKKFFSKTNFFLLKFLKKNKKFFSLVKCNLLSGRTNQIRIHFNSINHPLYLDYFYNKKNLDKDFFLFSYYLSFYHPFLNKNEKFLLKFNKKFLSF